MARGFAREGVRMFELAGEFCMDAAVVGEGPHSGLRDLAASVILQALHDLSCNQYGPRISATRFIREHGGGVWADYLGIERDTLRRAQRPLRSRGGRPHRNHDVAALKEALA